MTANGWAILYGLFRLALISTLLIIANSVYGESTLETFRKPTHWQVDEFDTYGSSDPKRYSDKSYRDDLKDCGYAKNCDGKDKEIFWMDLYHTGIDYDRKVRDEDTCINGGDNNKCVFSAASGRIARISRSGKNDQYMGNVVIIEHYQILPYFRIVYTLYAHLDWIDNNIKENNFIEAGQLIGEIGGTGKGDPEYWPPHLHFESKASDTLGPPEKSCETYRKTTGVNVLSFGYTSKHPSRCGYYDPSDFIDNDEYLFLSVVKFLNKKKPIPQEEIKNKISETYSSFPQTPPQGTSPTVLIGKVTDLRPDFDVFSDKGKDHEISANCDHCSGKPVDPGQEIYPRLTVQVANAHASKYKRKKKSDTIEGPIWWKIEGKTDWSLLASGEYTISNLKKNKERDETHIWTVPEYPGDILAMKACVDGDDEIWEEKEGNKRKKITGPDQSGTTNNCSRTERFYITPPAAPEVAANSTPTGAIEHGDCTQVTGWAKDADTPASLEVKVFTANPDGTNEQYLESFIASSNRADLGGEYGIEWAVPLSIQDRQSRKIVFYATNIPEGPNPAIGSVTLACPDDASGQTQPETPTAPSAPPSADTPATPPVTTPADPPETPPVVIPNTNAPDFTVSSLGLKEGNSVGYGSVIHPFCVIRNIGNITPSAGIRSAYYIDDVYRMDDGSDAGQLTPGRDQPEEVLNDSLYADAVGTRTLKCCVDYQGSVSESNEDNNCSTITFEVQAAPVETPPPPPEPTKSIAVTNPTPGEEWDSDRSHHIRWVSENVGSDKHVKISYSPDDGNTWYSIDDNTADDDSKEWDMPHDKNLCKHKDTSTARIRVMSVEYPEVSAISERFKIDYKKKHPDC
jgi:murein DD-endopeptidase MepM/ murein hydrolase activator NlpD